MTPEATRNLLLRRRELTGEQFNDATVKSWGDLLRNVEYQAAVEALNHAVVEHERVNARHLHEHLPAQPRREQRPSIGASDCPECDATGFSQVIDQHGTRRMAACATCRPDDHRRDMAIMRDNPEPVFAKGWAASQRASNREDF